MDFIVTRLSSYLPAELDLSAVIRFILIVAIGSIMIGLIGKMVFGKRSALNHSVSSAIGILFIYVLTVVIYEFNPAGLSSFLSPLPFVSFEGDYLTVFTFSGAELPAICTQVLNMLILALLANVFDSWVPQGKGIFSWYFFRFLSVVLAMISEIFITSLLNAFLPGVVSTYAPMILVGVLVLMVLLVGLKVLLGLVLTAVNPLLGAVYTFFFSSIFGKMLGKAIVTTVIMSVLVFVLEYLGYTVICIATSALSLYLPLMLVLLIMWYLLGHIL